MTARTIPLPALRLRAEVAPSPNTGTRRARATIYAGATMDRFDIFDGPYTLTLAMDGADLSRFNAGASVTLGHVESSDVQAVVGVTERAWIEAGRALAMLRFSDRDDVAPLWSDVKSGVVRNLSMDVALLEVQDVTQKGGAKALLATKWQPIALALVAAGADPGAQMQALSNQPTHPCVIRTGDSMADELDRTEEENTELEKLEAKAAKAEAKRRARIEQLASEDRGFGCGDVWAQRMIASEHSDNELVRLASADRVRRHNAVYPPTINNIGFGDTYDSGPLFVAARAEALAAKLTGSEPTDRARQHMQGASFTALAHDVLQRRRMHTFVDRGRSGDRRAVALALTTSDYPQILGDSARRTLVARYEAAAPTYRLIAARRNFTDYREHKFVSAGDFPELKLTGEAGEFQFGHFGERAESGRAFKYGRIVRFSRESLVNDDLGAFAELMQSYGQRIADTENGLFFSLLTSGAGLGPTMGDGGTLFNATAATTVGGHANYTSGGTAISDTSLNVGAAAMMVQRGIGEDGLGDGIALNIQPRYLLAAPAKRQLGIQYTSANYAPAAPASINTFSGILTPLFDANLTGNPWFLFADPSVIPAFIYGSLDSEPGPRVMTRQGFESEGLEMRVAFDFGVSALEWRGAYRNVGA